MRRRGARGANWSEGRLLAVVLGLILAASLGIWMNRQPRAELATPVHSVSAAALERIARVDINSAAAAELAALPGLGEALAARIVAWRAENGPFSSVEALLEVPGIGPGKLDGLRDRLRVG